jgi:hypothetical protein
MQTFQLRIQSDVDNLWSLQARDTSLEENLRSYMLHEDCLYTFILITYEILFICNSYKYGKDVKL